MSTMIHTSTGYVFEGIRAHMTGREKRILTAVATHEGTSAADIAHLTGIAVSTVLFIMRKLQNIHEVETDSENMEPDTSDKWYIKDQGIHSLHEAGILSLDELPPYRPEGDDK